MKFVLFVFASLHNFTDDNTLPSFLKTIDSLLKVFESESNYVLNGLMKMK